MFDLGIVAYVDRQAQAEALASEVSADYVAVDDGALGCEGNHHRVWGHLSGSTAYWTVVLEDDAMPVAGFRQQLTAALDHAPTSIVSLYLGRSRPPQWQARVERATYRANHGEAHWITHNRLLHAVGVAIKTRLVPDMLACTTSVTCRGLPIDEAISAWARASGYRVGYTWPSLVDHADGPTVAYHRDNAPRIAPRKAWHAGARKRWCTRQVPM